MQRALAFVMQLTCVTKKVTQGSLKCQSNLKPGYFYSTDIRAIHSSFKVELHVSEHAQDEPLDFFADIEHYQLRKRL